MSTATADSAGGVAVVMPQVIAPRRGDYIRTFTGRHFWPLDPRPEEVCIDDIAHALAENCRWTGHCKRHYSVAQHSVFVCDWVDRADKFTALLHDASEAYIADIAKPVKVFLPDYQEVERRLMDVCAQALGFTWPPSDAVKDADVFALAAEMWHLFEPKRQYIHLPPELQAIIRNDMELPVLQPYAAEERFLRHYYDYAPTTV